MKKLLIALSSILLLSCQMQPAMAETTIGVHIGSWHSEPGFNNRNPGVFINHNGWTAGTYYNSNRYQSYYAGYTFKQQINDTFSANVTVGAIKYAQWFPMVLPSLGMRNPLIGGETYVGLIPKTKFTRSYVVHVMHGWSF
jgi:hypothetical protein